MNPDNLNSPKNDNLTDSKIPEKKSEDFFIRPLRTYEDDVKDVIKNDNVSTAKIMLAEQRKREAEKEIVEETSIKSGRNITRITISVVLIILGFGAVAGAYFYYNYQIKKQNEIIPPALISENDFMDIDSTVKVQTTNSTNREILGQIRNVIKNSGSEMQNKTIKEIQLTKTITTNENGKEFRNETTIQTVDFVNILESRIPDQLLRNLDGKFFVGVHKNNDEIEPFIVFRTNDYEIAYSNMFQWENFLTRDVQDIFYQTLGSSQKFLGDAEIANNIAVTENENSDLENGTTTEKTAAENTATTTNTSIENITATTNSNLTNYDFKGFKDLILNNRDTRAILDNQNKLLFFYSFVDKKHLVMATSVETLTNVINRLNAAKLIR